MATAEGQLNDLFGRCSISPQWLPVWRLRLSCYDSKRSHSTWLPFLELSPAFAGLFYRLVTFMPSGPSWARE
jgi:hypothetical protein